MKVTISVNQRGVLTLPARLRKALGCDTLVTGDRTHFGALFGTTVAGVRILSPRVLAQAVWG